MLWMLFSYTYRHCNGCIRKAEKSPPGIDVISEFISLWPMSPHYIFLLMDHISDF